jgi:hypothetical protein
MCQRLYQAVVFLLLRIYILGRSETDAEALFCGRATWSYPLGCLVDASQQQLGNETLPVSVPPCPPF